MSLSSRQVYQLQKNGFIQSEITDLARATAPDGSPGAINLDHEVWQEAMKSRLAYCMKAIEDGLDPYEMVKQWYDRGRTRTPFDFIKEVYAKSMIGETSQSTSYSVYDRRHRAKDKVRKLYKPKFLPRYDESHY